TEPTSKQLVHKAAKMRKTPSFCFPSGDFAGWSQRYLETDNPSFRYSDLQKPVIRQAGTWKWKPTDSKSQLRPLHGFAAVKKQPAASPSPRVCTLERLPPEILGHIVSYLALNVPPTGYSPRNLDLISCLLSSRTLHAATLGVLYKAMTFSQSVTFSKALHHISQYPALGTLVRRLDFSHFTSVGLGRTRQSNAEIQNLTSRTLMLCLDLLPNLRECLLQEHLEGDLSVDVIRKLFTGLPHLRAVDFCGCSTRIFSQAFTEALATDRPLSNLQRLSLHECSTISSSALEFLVCHLTHLTHLDLARTQVSDSALLAIPETARITHLNLSRCSRLRSSALVKFLTTHAAVRDSLVYLNLMADSTPFRLSEYDLFALLPRISGTMRSLNLGGARITPDHVPFLVSLTTHLEELGLSSADLSVSDISSLFLSTVDGTEPGPNRGLRVSTLRYLDLAKVPKVTARSLFNEGSCLLSNQSWPLQVIEVTDKVTGYLSQPSKSLQSSVGWNAHESGRRSWYIRDMTSSPNHSVDDGSRPWKLGSRRWGMRKVPMSLGEVGGLYCHYMFKR
ncbi:hypothetical protein N7508_011192, partial [Penicillium antarcticum]|uniref:uncharacterized protein n=1 Tax=Penicillium antarcticum TaxID=416450 RepID=UPI00239BEE86